MSSFKVIIIGSGLAGATLANGLMNNGIDFQVYEKYERHSSRDGFQIRLTAPALTALKSCLTSQHLAAIMRKFGPSSGLQSEAPRIIHKDFRLLVDLSKYPVYGRSAPVNRGVLRDALSDTIYDAGKLKYDMAFERYEVIRTSLGNERIRVWLQNGAYDDCDLLIGADGSYSKINVQVGLNSISPIPNHTAFASKCDLPTSRFVGMSKELLGGPIMTWADKMSFFFGVYLPKRLNVGGATIPGDDEDTHDKGHSSCMVGLNVPNENVPIDINSASNSKQWDFVAQQIAHWSPYHREIVEMIRGASLHIYVPRVATRPPKDWRKRVCSTTSEVEKGHPRVWLMGDAVHAMLPPRGMGGNQSMYDAAVMLPLIKELNSAARDQDVEEGASTAAVEKALSKYEIEMIPRAFEWVKKSGGNDFVPVDSSTLFGRMFFLVAAQVLTVACFWAKLVRICFGQEMVDEDIQFQVPQ